MSFIMIVMVVYIHSYYKEAEHYAFSNRIQLFISGITAFAVPCFYTISGFLFFNGLDDLEECRKRVAKRFKTLVIPYIIWNMVFVGWYVVLALLPFASAYVNSDMLSSLSIDNPLTSFKFIFINPAGFHLWFLRDLILFVLLTPVIYYLIRKLKWYSLLIVFLATGWITRFWLSYFVIGALIGYSGTIEKFRPSRNLTIITTVLFIAYCSFKSFVDFSLPVILGNYIANMTNILGLVAFWGLYDIVMDNNADEESSIFNSFIGYSFFIYLFHEPSFNIIKKLALKLTGVNDVSLTILYLVNPLVMCLIAISVAKILENMVPSIYRISVGGRSVKKE